MVFLYFYYGFFVITIYAMEKFVFGQIKIIIKIHSKTTKILLKSKNLSLMSKGIFGFYKVFVIRKSV
jgi:hypothetical protein